MAETRDVRIAGRRFSLRRGDIERALRDVEPEPIASHYVVVAGKRYPPKQAIGAATGLDRADFTTHQARRTLLRLGFPAGRRGATAANRSGERSPAGLGERLRPHAGRWVAIKDDDVLHAAASPQDLVGWLARHGQSADSMFRVPEDDVAASGLAPL
jgi:hypothetical protein